MSVAIDVNKEKLVPVREVPSLISKWIPGQRPVSYSALLRWIRSGVAGVRLDSVLIAGSKYTSREALNRFFNDSAQAKSKRHSQATKRGIRLSKTNHP